jgi:signal transduction histidine kinase
MKFTDAGSIVISVSVVTLLPQDDYSLPSDKACAMPHLLFQVVLPLFLPNPLYCRLKSKNVSNLSVVYPGFVLLLPPSSKHFLSPSLPLSTLLDRSSCLIVLSQVTDTGIGMDHDTLTNLFQRFYQGKGTMTRQVGDYFNSLILFSTI